MVRPDAIDFLFRVPHQLIPGIRRKKYGHILIPEPDGQKKHPEHLQQHNHLQVLQRYALNGNTEKVREMIAELPEHQVKDTIEMLRRTVADFGRELEL